LTVIRDVDRGTIAMPIIIFDSYDMSPVLFDTGKSARESWYYFTEDELSPGAFRWHNWKFVFNLLSHVFDELFARCQ
jgi:hypothetical protein